MTRQFSALSDVLETAWQHASATVAERPSVPEVIDDVQGLADTRHDDTERARDRRDRECERLIVRICATNLPSGIIERGQLKTEIAGVYTQVAEGKGQQRHGAFGLDVQEQAGVQSMKRWGIGFPAGQCEKKLHESMRLPAGHAERERRGAAGYLALWLVAEAS